MTNSSTPEAPLTREEDSATALGGIQGQLVKGEDLAPALRRGCDSGRGCSLAEHIPRGQRGTGMRSEPPGR